MTIDIPKPVLPGHGTMHLDSRTSRAIRDSGNSSNTIGGFENRVDVFGVIKHFIIITLTIVQSFLCFFMFS